MTINTISPFSGEKELQDLSKAATSSNESVKRNFVYVDIF